MATVVVHLLTSFSELPFRHLFEYLDGEMTSSASFSRKINIQLSGCKNFPVVNFETIKSAEINVTKTDLTKGQ